MSIAAPVKRRWRMKVVLPAAAVAVATVVAVLLLLTPSPPTLTERDVILLADFVNTTGDSAFDGTLKQALAVKLEESPFLNIFPQDRVRETLRFMGRTPDERITDSVAREICQRERIMAVLNSSIAALGTHYVIGLDAVNCATGESLAREQSEAGSKEQVLTELGQAASRLRARLGESLASIQKFDKPIEEATTTSLEALQAFTEGRRLNLAGDFRQAVSFLQRAVDLDPDFAMGYYLLGTAYGNSGQNRPAVENLTKAFELRERVSELERLSISGLYYLQVFRDLDKAIETYELLKQIYPRDSPVRHLLGTTYRELGRLEDGLAEHQEAVRLNPRGALQRIGLVNAYTQLSRFEDAKAALKTVIEDKLETSATHFFLYQIAFIEGDAQAMQREVDWVPAVQVQAAIFSGKITEATKLSLQVPFGQRGRQGGLQRSGFAGARGANDRWAPLNTLTRAAFDISLPPEAGQANPVDPSAAVALALGGDPAQAKKFIDELSKAFPKDTLLNSVTIPTAMAAIEIRAGNGTAAVSMLRAATPYEPGSASLVAIYMRGLAYLQAKSGLEAAAEFQKIIANRGVDPDSVLYPLSHLGLGRAYVLAGDLPKARKSYQDFFGIWKDADADIPILVKAKQEYDKLN